MSSNPLAELGDFDFPREVDKESGKPIFTSDAHAYSQRWYFVILR